MTALATPLNTTQADVHSSGATIAQMALACGPFVVLALLHWNVEPSVFSGDWAQYVLHARALIEGRSYTDTGYLFTPQNWSIGPRAYPPGLPLTIAPLLLAGSLAPALLRLAMIVSGVLFLVFVFRRFGQSATPWIAAIAAAWCGVALELSWASVVVLSDLGFCFFCWFVIDRIDAREPWSRSRMALVAVGGLAAMSYRVAGLALPAALALYVVLNFRRGVRPQLQVLAIWVASLAAVAFLARDMLPSNSIAPAIGDLIWRVLSAVRVMRFSLFEAQAYPFAGAALNNAYHLLATLLTAVGLVVLLRREWRSFLVIFSVVYVGMIAVSPVADTRYLWPVFPLVGFAMLTGGAQLLRLFRLSLTARQEAIVGGFAAAIVLTFAAFRGGTTPVPQGFSAFPDAVALVDYVKDAGSRGEISRVAFINPRVLTLKTGVPAMGFVSAKPSDVSQLLQRLQISHVILGGFREGGCGIEAMAYAKAAYPESFQTLSRFGRFSVERFVPPDSAALSHPRVVDRSPAELGTCRRAS